MTKKEFKNLKNGQKLITKYVEDPIIEWDDDGFMEVLVGQTFTFNGYNKGDDCIRALDWSWSYDCLDFYEDTADNFNKRALKE
jgi:hypothetical protein